MRTSLRAAVLFIAITLPSFETNAGCQCNRSLPLFASDPFLFADEGLIAYVNPEMVFVLETGECFVDNEEGFYEADVLDTFFIGHEEHALVQVFNTDFSHWYWADIEELNQWAQTICDTHQLSA
jgi:hypothetical protein